MARSTTKAKPVVKKKGGSKAAKKQDNNDPEPEPVRPVHESLMTKKQKAQHKLRMAQEFKEEQKRAVEPVDEEEEEDEESDFSGLEDEDEEVGDEEDDADDGEDSEDDDEDGEGPQKGLSEAQLSSLNDVAVKKARAVQSRLAEAKKESKQPTNEAGEKDRGVVYLGHIPWGFFEEQISGFFSQFGAVTRLRLARSRKTGNSKGFAFVEFRNKEVAAIAAESMNKYMMFGRTLVCHVVEPDRLHEDTFRHCKKKFRVIPWRKIAREEHNRKRTREEQQKRVKALVRKENQKRRKLKASGIDYDFPGVASLATDFLKDGAVEEEEEEEEPSAAPVAETQVKKGQKKQKKTRPLATPREPEPQAEQKDEEDEERKPVGKAQSKAKGKGKAATAATVDVVAKQKKTPKVKAKANLVEEPATTKGKAKAAKKTATPKQNKKGKKK